MNKINILPQLILLFISIGMIVFSNQGSREEIVDINLEGFIEKLESKQEIYGIFISDNCVYCNEMEAIYKEFSKTTDNLYFINLSNKNIGDEKVEELKLNVVPTIIKYKEGVEINRIEGTSSLENLKQELK